MSKAPDPAAASGQEVARYWLENAPFARLLGLRLVDVGPEHATVAMPFKEELPTTANMIHGGAITALLDSAGTAAAFSEADWTKTTRAGSVTITVDFLAPALGVDLVARARTLRRGRTLCFSEAEVEDPDGNLVAKALLTYRLA